MSAHVAGKLSAACSCYYVSDLPIYLWFLRVPRTLLLRISYGDVNIRSGGKHSLLKTVPSLPGAQEGTYDILLD